jgi:hypothetical protein
VPEELTITGRITRQGPQAPHAGDGFALSVYEYEVVEGAGSLQAGVIIDVAHRESDANELGFSVGRLRRLHLSSELPPRATLLNRDGPSRGGRVWFCDESSTGGAR